ncbi:Enolase (plasmid) [Agreia sp. COWG]|nr:Enolase [Agreia sp. COWG]
MDGTPNLGRLGANAVIAVSMAAARAFAVARGLALHEWIAETTAAVELLPVPHFNVLNGGAHAANDLVFQEFMIAPVGATSEADAIEIGAAVYHALAGLVRARYGAVGLGDEGGFAPPITHPTEALDLLVDAITAAGFTPGLDGVAIAMDPAANGFYDGTAYTIAGERLNSEQLVAFYVDLLDRYPIRSIEDGFAEDDHAGWQQLYQAAGHRVQLVGDDLYVTDPSRIQDGADQGYSNAALIKPNQIGTVTEAFDAIEAAHRNGMACMISHRSGETDDTFIADLAVGSGVGQIKSGAPAREERVLKYNRLSAIEAHNTSLGYGLR